MGKLRVILLSLAAVIAIIAYGQSRHAKSSHYREISGQVTDSVSGEHLSYVTVTLPKANRGVLSDERGRYTIYSSIPTDSIFFTSVGYKPEKIAVKDIYEGTMNVRMVPETYALEEVIVKPKKQKYSKKNNPAVELMERIRATRDLNDPLTLPYYAFDRYEKLSLAVNNVSTEEATKGLGKKFNFALDFIDTARFTGKPILNIAVREKASRRLFRNSPKADKEVVTGLRNVGLDENFNQENMQKIMEDVFRDVDIYQNDITLLQNRFVSPLSKIGADYYKYFITDTVPDKDGGRLIELTFAPHNPESFSFNGKLYVALGDTTNFIRRIKMQVPKAINLNFVENLFIEQEFERDSLGMRHKVTDDMVVEFKLIPGIPEIYARRLAVAGNFSYEKDEYLKDFYELEGRQYVLKKAVARDDTFWTGGNIPSLSRNESRMEEFMKRLRGVPVYYWGEKFLRLMSFGYFKIGKPSVFDLGPINTMVSFNDVEGTRFRLGGNTTANLSPHFFTRFYGAYGTKDHRWKYKGELEYSFTAKKYHSREFPVHSLRLTHQYDLDMIGQHYLFTNADNIFLSLKRGKNDKMTYRRLTDFEYTMERLSGFSINAGLRHEIQYATPWLPFVDGYGVARNHFTQATFHLKLRYAPGETFYQSQSERLPINMDSWIFQFTHEYGPKGFLGADFTLNKSEVSVQKRFWFSSFGYLDAIVKGGKIWSQVPFTALSWANANLSYTIQPESFALMNPMEFAADEYATCDLTYWMNGLIFNRIPLLNRAKLREVVSFRAYCGHLTGKNDPSLHPELFRFPADAGVSRLGKTPYMEVGVGLDNILKLLRVDYVWRLSYRDVPGVDRSGVRIQLHLSF